MGADDLVTFYDGDDLSAKVLGQYGGSRASFKLYTSTADVTIQFQSDPATSVYGYGNGFVVHFFGEPPNRLALGRQLDSFRLALVLASVSKGMCKAIFRSDGGPSPVSAGFFHQRRKTLFASAPRLIRLDESGGEGTAGEYRSTREKKENSNGCALQDGGVRWF